MLFFAIIAAAGEGFHLDGVEQPHLGIQAQGFHRHPAEFGEVADFEHVR